MFRKYSCGETYFDIHKIYCFGKERVGQNNILNKYVNINKIGVQKDE